MLMSFALHKDHIFGTYKERIFFKKKQCINNVNLSLFSIEEIAKNAGNFQPDFTLAHLSADTDFSKNLVQ